MSLTVNFALKPLADCQDACEVVKLMERFVPLSVLMNVENSFKIRSNVQCDILENI